VHEKSSEAPLLCVPLELRTLFHAHWYANVCLVIVVLVHTVNN